MHSFPFLHIQFIFVLSIHHSPLLSIFFIVYALPIHAGKQNYLVKLCRELFETGDDNNDINNWKLVEKLLNPPPGVLPDAALKRHIRNSLLFKDDEVVNFDGERTIGNHCLHYVLRSNNISVVELVHRKCPRVAQIKNKIFPGDDPESPHDHLTPREIISENSESLYNNLKGYLFPESFESETVIMPSKTWRILAKGEGNWDIRKIEFFSEYSKNQGVAITPQIESADSSKSADATNHGPGEAFNTDDSSYWQGLSDREGCWISMEFDSPQIVKSIRIKNGPNRGHRVNKLYIQAKKFGEWQTQSINSRLDQNLDVYSVDEGDWGLEHSDQWNLLTFTQATSSSLYQTGWEPERALDASGMFSTTYEQNPWWKGTLDGTAEISKIIITQRSDNPQLWFRMLHFQLTIFRDGEEVYYSDEHGLDEERAYEINLPTPVEGDSVMIRLPRFNPKMEQETSEPNKRILTLKDVRAYNSDVGPYTETQVDFKQATASSTYSNDWRADYAMPGHPNKSFHSYVDPNKLNPWWKGTLKDKIEITRISISNRHDGAELYRMLGFQLIIFKDGVEVYYSLAHGREVKDIYEINFKDPEGRDTTVEGDAIMIRLPRNNPQTMKVEPLQFGEVRVYKRTDV